MNQALESPFIAAAIACFDRLSECPELKNYRIYCDPGTASHQPVRENAARVETQTAMPARRRSQKWIVLVSAKRAGQVNVQICR